MIFNQFEFLFLFLPIVVCGFFLPYLRQIRVYILICASLVFYGISGLEHAIVLVVDIIWVYVLTRREHIVGNRLLLALAVIPPALALFYYKYLGFFLNDVLNLNTDHLSESFSLFTNIILPAGISFFTFQVVSFAIDRYRGEISDIPALSKFALYISFFPQLVAGPILRYHNVVKGLNRLETFQISRERISKAIGYIVIGLGAKVLIADTIGHHLSPLIQNPGNLSILGSIYTVFAYSFQIYFDFYGYSLIAIGLGALFGFDFPKNFDRPYEALNGRDFWRRWHITLSFWIRDYLYLPLGGNRNYVKNILIVFAVCGLWHGAGWTFIVWGLYHALLIIFYHATQKWWDRAPKLIQQATTFMLVSFGWTLFLFDFEGIKAFMHSLLGQAHQITGEPSFDMWSVLTIAALVCFGIRFENLAERCEKRLSLSLGQTCGMAFLFALTVLFLDRSQTFIYFRF
jgi:alginate O-acetyltransferase complex protein AlgI